MSEVTREYRIRNEYVRGTIGVALIAKKMKENRFRLIYGEMKQKQRKWL